MSIEDLPVRITYNGQSVDGHILFGSEDGHRLFLSWSTEITLKSKRGAIFMGHMAIVFVPGRHRYEDLIENDEVTIEFEPNRAGQSK